MVELVMVNVAALALLAVLSKREGSSYLAQRKRVKDALRAANRGAEGASTAAAESRSRTGARGLAFRPATVGVYALGMMAVVTALAAEADTDPDAMAGTDPVLESLEGADALPTLDASGFEFRGLGELCADGAAEATGEPSGPRGPTLEVGRTAPAVRLAKIRLERLEDRMEARVARALARLESGPGGAVVVRGG